MKKVLLAFFICSALLSSAAETREFSYVDDSVDNFVGTQRKENYDVAIFLPGNQFKNLKVAKITAQLNGREKDNVKDYSNYSNISVWVSSELTLEDKINVTEVSYPATVDENGFVSLELPETYTITEKGAYVGYSFEITRLDSGTKYPLTVGAPGNENALWVHTSRTYLKWTNIAESVGYSSTISVGLQSDNFAAGSVSFSSVPEQVNVECYNDTTVNVQLSTFGKDPVSSVDYDITVAGNTTSYHYDLPEAVPARLGKIFDASVVIPAQSNAMLEDITLTVTKVNGVDNEAGNAKSASLKLNVVKLLPKHQALLEEYTSLGCGFCTRGYAALEHIKKNYPDFVVASYHTYYNGVFDAMTSVSSFPNTPSGFPAAYLDRSVSCDPYYGSKNLNTQIPIVDEILAINEEYTPWDIKVAHTWDDDNTLTANVDVTCIENKEGTFKIAYILVADGLSGNGDNWNQTNYYNSYNQDESVVPELNNFCRGGIYGKGSVAGLIFDDVVISDQGIKGIKGSIPKTVTAYEEVSHSFTFDLSKISSSLIPDKNKLRIIVAVLDSRDRSLNCAKHDVTDYVGAAVDQVEVSDNDAPVEYYNLNGVKVDNPANGIFIRRQGSRTSKVVVK